MSGLDDTSVTIIVPTYNRARYIGQALESLLSQTLPAKQVIVVDDGSKDNTRDIVSGFTAVEYVWKPNGGKSTALNLGLKHASGNLIWIFDDDDIAAPDALESLVSALAQNPRCGFAYGDYDMFTTEKDGKMYTVGVSFPAVRPDSLYLALLERSFIAQQGLLVRKSCYEEVGPFDEALVRSQDFEMMLRLARRYIGVRVNGVTAHLRQHSGVRGSESSPVSATKVVDSWVKHDYKIISEVYRTHELREFLPTATSRDLTDSETFTALLQRLCILARRGVWKEAARDLQQMQEIALRTGRTRLSTEETAILRRMFDVFSYAPHTFDTTSAFFSVLRGVKPLRLRHEMRAAMVWSLPFSIGAALLHHQYGDFKRFLHVYFALATPRAALRAFLSPSFFTTGLQLVRNRRRAPLTHNSNLQKPVYDSTAI